ncbi:transmembrane protein, putative [Medicago truncatula]|uniref:Transmembrane protein, putative n=1 Tax=Medicago truncatula TaxID=3880 RepID=G7JTS3_MEDTR|nr:transmembrane protein, putative [Medicago truncatula]
MEKEIETFLRKLSLVAIAIASLTLLILFLQIPNTRVPSEAPSKPHLRFPKSTCDFTSTHLHLPSHKKNNRLWSSRDWNNKLHSFSRLFLHIRNLGHEVSALQKLGVEEVTGVELLDSPPLVSREDLHNLFDEALFPARFVAKMERVVRAGGVCFVLVGECGANEVREVVGLFRNSRFVSSSNVSLNLGNMEVLCASESIGVVLFLWRNLVAMKDCTWGVGSVIRNEDGEVLAAATWTVKGFDDFTVAEVYARYKTVKFAAECCFRKIILESDCEKLV